MFDSKSRMKGVASLSLKHLLNKNILLKLFKHCLQSTSHQCNKKVPGCPHHSVTYLHTLWSQSHVESSCSHVGAPNGLDLLHAAEFGLGKQLQEENGMSSHGPDPNTARISLELNHPVLNKEDGLFSV